MSTDQELGAQLRDAESELAMWEQQRLTREDGSPAQDMRFETRGDRLREKVEELKAQMKIKPSANG